MKPVVLAFILLFALTQPGCKKNGTTTTPQDASLSFKVNGTYNGTITYTALNLKPVITVNFTQPVSSSAANSGIQLTTAGGSRVASNMSLQDGDKTVILTPQSALQPLSEYKFSISPTLQTASGGRVINAVTLTLKTGIDSTDKFPTISDNLLLDSVQLKTFNYFWEFGHPVSGLARERNTSNETVTSGGSGFGIMAMIAGINRGFVTRAQGLARMQKIVGFLKNTAQKFHGAFPHWLNGTTGAVVPFSAKDNGADLVETAFLVQGLLSARQYFNTADAAETALRNDINAIWHGVEWSWFRKANENVLYWHWSPNFGFDINLPIRGWNESLVVYVLAAASPTYSIPKVVYTEGWARNGAMVNNNSYYGIRLPLGGNLGGPLFFEHYSFLGINPDDLTDAYANYETQTAAHTLINYEYSKANPKRYYGYSDESWGLTASDIPNGYTASSPTNDVGVIAPTAALSSFPYAPAEAMKALKFFYYKLGDRLWGPYGFYDAYSLDKQWFASSYLAIDQGPIVVMIENYRTKLLWNLFMSCPEVKAGLLKLGFQSPNI
jgi:hypothetical protein